MRNNGTESGAKRLRFLSHAALGIPVAGVVCGLVSMGADQQLPPIAAIEDVIEALRRLGVGVGVDESVPGVDLALAYSAVGAAERNAFATEQHARARGAGPAEFGEAVGAVLDGAACHSDLEVLALLEWRITRTTQALQLLDLSGPHGDVDPLARTILLTTGALSGLLAAAVTMRNPDRSATATRDSARALRAAIQALDEATADVREHELTAQLLDLTD